MSTTNNPAQGPTMAAPFRPRPYAESRHLFDQNNAPRPVADLTPDDFVKDVLAAGYPVLYQKEVLWQLFGSWFCSINADGVSQGERENIWFYFMETQKQLSYLDGKQELTQRANLSTKPDKAALLIEMSAMENRLIQLRRSLTEQGEE